MEALPFKIPDVHGGLAKTTGLMRLDGDELALEFETRDEVLGVIRSGVKVLRVPVAELDAVRYSRRMLSGRMRLRARSMTTFADVPKHEQGEIELRFARRDAEDAWDFAAQLARRLGQPEP